MDGFKKYLQQHRNEMDVDAPSEQLLQRIQMRSTVKKKASLYTMALRYAAAACVLVATGLGFKLLINSSGKKLPGSIVIENSPQIKNEPASMKHEQLIDSLNNTAAVIARNDKVIHQSREAKKRTAVPYELMYSFERNYSQLVNLQLKSIRTTPVYGEAPDYFDGFKKALAQIETDELSIKNHIKEKGLNDALLEQLINVYQEKLSLLKNLQQEMNQMNKKLKDNQQPSDTLTGHFINI